MTQHYLLKDHSFFQSTAIPLWTIKLSYTGRSILNPFSSIGIFVYLYANTLLSLLLRLYSKSGYPAVLVFSSCSFSSRLSFESAPLSAPLEFPSAIEGNSCTQDLCTRSCPSWSSLHPVTVRCKCRKMRSFQPAGDILMGDSLLTSPLGWLRLCWTAW